MDILQIMGFGVSIALPLAGTCLAIHCQSTKEMKDFHGRLCTLEERYIQMMQRFLESKG